MITTNTTLFSEIENVTELHSSFIKSIYNGDDSDHLPA